MSRLWRDRVYAALAPDRIVLVRTHGGLGPKVAAKATMPVARDTTGGWKPPLAELGQALRTQSKWQDAALMVVLSNAFVRYQIVPWSEAVDTDAERTAYVRQSFAQVYGEASAGWVYQISESGPGAPWLAGAIDRALLTQLEAAAEAARCTLVSVQPRLMPAFNSARSLLKEKNCWFVQQDQDRLLLALILGGQWRAIGSRRAEAADWLAELPLALEREWRMQGAGEIPRAVYLSAPEMRQTTRAGGGSWVYHWLPTRVKHGLDGQADAAYAAMLGA